MISADVMSVFETGFETDEEFFYRLFPSKVNHERLSTPIPS